MGITAEEAFKKFEEKNNYLGCNKPNYVAGYRDGYNAANPDENLKEFLNHWTADGRLQTFEDSERFRKEATTLLTTQK